ncbi:hypothetical protein [Niveispirillum sp. KHB5.9]|uniref:hypothetical protein n=1 Tax=Niveispirillum sp. KHB5.9 TaxID=3400269 RepID=UPI003A8A2A7E
MERNGDEQTIAPKAGRARHGSSRDHRHSAIRNDNRRNLDVMRAYWTQFWIKAFLALAVLASPLVAGSAFADESSAQQAVRSLAKVKDLLFDPDAAVQWQVGVLNDGTKRYGYAMSICDILKEHGAATPKTKVRIVDIVAVTSQGKNFREASLGGVKCSDYSRFDP